MQPELASLSVATSARFDGLESLMSRLTKQLDDINTQVWSLRDDFPELINHAVRVALRNTLD